MTSFNTKDFYGSVQLKDWIMGLDGIMYRTLTGRCSVYKDKEIVGFEAHGNESNWVIRVEGNEEAWVILGCQIRGVVVHQPRRATAKDTLLVP